MNTKARLMILSVLLCLVALAAFALFFSGREASESLDGDPLRERGMRAAAIAGELVSVARGQLEALPDEHRAEVGEVLGELEESVAAVKTLLADRKADEEALAAAVAALEKVLDGVLVVPDNETKQQERSADS